MRQWHLEEEFGGGIPDVIAGILGFVFLFWITFTSYTKFPKIAPLVGVCIYGYLTYKTSHMYDRNFFVLGFLGLSTLFAARVTYDDFFVDDPRKRIMECDTEFVDQLVDLPNSHKVPKKNQDIIKEKPKTSQKQAVIRSTTAVVDHPEITGTSNGRCVNCDSLNGEWRTHCYNCNTELRTVISSLHREINHSYEKSMRELRADMKKLTKPSSDRLPEDVSVNPGNNTQVFAP